jgi:organic hydroperoxide reductase OsmC/OhrA
MTRKEHAYAATLTWTGNQGTGTSHYAAYARDHEIAFPGKPALHASSDPSFRGDPKRYNPEELLVGALSSCHMLWYLHLCAVAGVVVEGYIDKAGGIMAMNPDGSGQFTSVTLRPEVTISKGDPEKARALHEKAAEMCFVARSVNFPVGHEPTIKAA